MWKRGEPAPQWDPLRRSYPSSVRVIPLTSFRSAPAAALLLVGPVLTRSRPSVALSFGSPVVHAASVYVPVGLVAGYATTLAPVGQPRPLSHAALRRLVLPGS